MNPLGKDWHPWEKTIQQTVLFRCYKENKAIQSFSHQTLAKRRIVIIYIGIVIQTDERESMMNEPRKPRNVAREFYASQKLGNILWC